MEKRRLLSRDDILREKYHLLELSIRLLKMKKS